MIMIVVGLGKSTILSSWERALELLFRQSTVEPRCAGLHLRCSHPLDLVFFVWIRCRTPTPDNVKTPSFKTVPRYKVQGTGC